MDINIKSDFYIKKEIKKFIERSKDFCSSNQLKYNEIQSLYFYMKKLETYMQKNKIDATINIQHVDNNTVESFYNSLQNKVFMEQEKMKINISPEVLYRMHKDKEYATKMLAAILKCAKPKNFNEFKLMLYDYNIFIKNDGRIEVVSYGDVDYEKMSKERRKLKAQQAVSKARIIERINQLKSTIYSRYVYTNNHLKLIAHNECDKKYIPYEYFLNQNSELKRLMAELGDAY